MLPPGGGCHASMVDTTTATLQKLQSDLQCGGIEPSRCELFPELSVLFDEAERKPQSLSLAESPATHRRTLPVAHTALKVI